MAIHQISVFLENRAGQLAEITALLAKNGIDLRAINIAETSDYGVLRLIGIDPNEEEEQLGEEDIRMMVDASSEHGGIDHEEKEFIQNVFEFDDLTAEEIAGGAPSLSHV